jgi:hypothetical protein
MSEYLRQYLLLLQAQTKELFHEPNRVASEYFLESQRYIFQFLLALISLIRVGHLIDPCDWIIVNLENADKQFETPQAGRINFKY